MCVCLYDQSCAINVYSIFRSFTHDTYISPLSPSAIIFCVTHTTFQVMAREKVSSVNTERGGGALNSVCPVVGGCFANDLVMGVFTRTGVYMGRGFGPSS